MLRCGKRVPLGEAHLQRGGGWMDWGREKREARDCQSGTRATRGFVARAGASRDEPLTRLDDVVRGAPGPPVVGVAHLQSPLLCPRFALFALMKHVGAK